MFGIGWSEFILVALILLIFVGPKHMPGMLRKFGMIVAELRSASRELRNQIEVEMAEIETPAKIMRDMEQELKDSIPSPYDEIKKAEREAQKEFENALADDGDPGERDLEDDAPGDEDPEPTETDSSKKKAPREQL